MPACRFLAILLIALFVNILSAVPAPAAQHSLVDEAGCAACHAAQQRSHAGSQHARAMQSATAATVKGLFDGGSFRQDGQLTRFFRRGGRFFVNTDGPDGRRRDFEVHHTFGLEPLQQYLVALPGGRLQALTTAWDVKGKRWYSLHPDERIDYRDVLHWSRPPQNWNAMCAACHSTGLRKNYDPVSGRYATTYAAQGVTCQACHGPAGGHLAWARGRRSGEAPPHKGFAADLRAGNGQVQTEACGYCHVLRATLTSAYPVGQPLLDHALPVGLPAGRYFNDGQQRDEVFNLGSWQQSRMHARGLVCTDCHDAHSGKTRAAGNALCTGCHNPVGPAAGPHVDTRGLQRKDYDSPAHHHHDTPVSCVDCHAPKRSYMGVDPRLDHAFRIPRPDLSAETASPNACNLCHTDKDPAWAAAAVARWYGDGRRAEYHYGQAFAAARGMRPGAAAGLQRIAGDAAQPPIVRAEALEELAAYPGPAAARLALAALADPDGRLRIAAIHAVAALAPREALREVQPLLADPLRAVRIEAARALAPALPQLAPARREAWLAARREAEAAARENADFPQSWLGLAPLLEATGDIGGAEQALRQALRLDPAYLAGIINLADLLRRQGRESDAEALLRDGLKRLPQEAALHEALALGLIRQQRKADALALLTRAAPLPSASGRTAYLHAALLADAGRRNEAIQVLENAARERGERDLLLALAGYQRQAGDTTAAETTLRRLADINPDDPALGRRP
ncbi:tetratricopeptide repeat protein [Zoogloea dura]|uniref:Tetratricopeptide repeat protein n=1 Tax=Zoogloea dura TaxID=2728840 RepID=A0A848GF13_9RHOO|nr:tetratricopeptide repeat protein [Zoogloea dura]NML28011.1 tetratricopeptide repeat protein [Zoogloea dura]